MMCLCPDCNSINFGSPSTNKAHFKCGDCNTEFLLFPKGGLDKAIEEKAQELLRKMFEEFLKTVKESERVRGPLK